MMDGAAGLLRNVDLAFAKPFDQIVGRKIDQFDFGGRREHVIRHGLANLDAGNLFDDVVEALQVLNVERGVDVDAGVQELFTSCQRLT